MPGEPLDAPENLPKEGPGQVTLGNIEQPTRPNVRTLALRHSITRVSPRIAPARKPGRSRNLYPGRYIASRCTARTLVAGVVHSSVRRWRHDTCHRLGDGRASNEDRCRAASAGHRAFGHGRPGNGEDRACWNAGRDSSSGTTPGRADRLHRHGPRPLPRSHGLHPRHDARRDSGHECARTLGAPTRMASTGLTMLCGFMVATL